MAAACAEHRPALRGDAMRFKNQVALVTGGGRGIGAACVRRFSEDGAAVVIADLDRKSVV